MITLYTAPTPNGVKVSVLLEELGVPYRVHAVNLTALEQKEEWFLKLNPNGRIPVIVDHDNQDFAVFESGAILVYLAEKFKKFIPDDPKQKSVVMQWLFFQMAGIGPMMGQAHVFVHYAPEVIPYAINRYRNESRRLFEVLEKRLEGREYLADEYSIADIANYTWVRVHKHGGINVEGLPNVHAWLERISARPGVQKGLDVPIPQAELAKRTQEEQKKHNDQIKNMVPQ